jgi:Rieske Fe-S protein
MRYLAGLARAIEAKGGLIYCDTRAARIDDGSPARVETTRGYTVTAQSVVVATNSPISDRLAIHTKQAAYRTFAIAIALGSADMPRGLFWDTDDPYHYTRAHRVGRSTYLIVGGEDHKTGTESETEECYLRLDEYTRARFTIQEIGYRWSGQIIEPVDRLPYIGRNAMSSHLHVATGYSGNGMTFGTLAGMMLADQIAGRANKYADLYAATRITPLASAADYLTENIDYPRYLLADRLTSIDADSGSPEELARGEGGVFSMVGAKYAVCRDAEGRLHALSPICTHLGCDVRWNLAERTWDCPCHGSRFSPDGQVINGPATADLPAKRLPETRKERAPRRRHATAPVRTARASESEG